MLFEIFIEENHPILKQLAIEADKRGAVMATCVTDAESQLRGLIIDQHEFMIGGGWADLCVAILARELLAAGAIKVTVDLPRCACDNDDIGFGDEAIEKRRMALKDRLGPTYDSQRLMVLPTK